MPDYLTAPSGAGCLVICGAFVASLLALATDDWLEIEQTAKTGESYFPIPGCWTWMWGKGNVVHWFVIRPVTLLNEEFWIFSLVFSLEDVPTKTALYFFSSAVCCWVLFCSVKVLKPAWRQDKKPIHLLGPGSWSGSQWPSFLLFDLDSSGLPSSEGVFCQATALVF